MRDEFVYLKADYEYKLDSSLAAGGPMDTLSGTFMNTMKTIELNTTNKKIGCSLNVFQYIDDQL